ncbi:hypothetical protein AQUCO_00500357v1 [Aquilegia coerulea]|uniref:DUF2996 domain-containing protein n=1 Tax=Aquilegia coerulea TaxID=218851 RepID=A0A2G5ERK7_AQUCA|nr:hypothetical protein AQUCO_00500357v1 [Aquilegia coerulea]
MPYNMACRSVNLPSPLMKSIRVSSFPVFSTILPAKDEQKACMLALSVRTVKCSAVQETSTSTASAETKETNVVKKAAPAPKPKVPAKAPAKPLPQLMEEDVVPSLKATFEAQDDLSEIEVFFQDNRLEGSFMKNATRYTFWAFFPDGVLTGPKGFSLSSYGSEVSTVEPFLIDEKKITGKMIVFWIEKRLAAQGILPVWKD